MIVPRYAIDRVGNLEWAIFDSTKNAQPTVYMMYIIETVGMFNYQLIMTSYDAIEAARTLIPVLDPEIYSVSFYSLPEGLGTFVYNVINVLLDSDIDNPVDLAYFFGGMIRSQTMRQDRYQLAH